MVCNRKYKTYKKYTKLMRNKDHYQSRKQAGFGLIESLIALTILVFVFTSFMAVMLRSATVASRTNNEVAIDILLDNRIENSWITGDAIDTAANGNIVFTQGTTELTGRNTLLNVEQQRTFAVVIP
ncbi:prepilin-type N-terminal cleavage/methylation domain-containing protein [Cysteiniphilum sp. JM-1]|uniref:type IV pilus modification PilV family protein n=1 Tax=Cysteiniphilum sp. JM-1 TaxID=2610891 RepID=UPI0012445A06|nr:prepilin-type N-terminal cleavage/methylation domain-containing protein [Cysteiniphilum sp. JM-1]